MIDKYDVNLVISEEFCKRLSSLKMFLREIDKVKYKYSKYVMSLFCFDVKLEHNKNASQFMKNLKFNKEESLIARNEYTKDITEQRLNIKNIFRFDPEIIFIRPKYLNTFVKYYQFGYDFYTVKNYKKSIEALENALQFNHTDKKTVALLEKIESLLQENGLILL